MARVAAGRQAAACRAGGLPVRARVPPAYACVHGQPAQQAAAGTSSGAAAATLMQALPQLTPQGHQLDLGEGRGAAPLWGYGPYTQFNSIGLDALVWLTNKPPRQMPVSLALAGGEGKQTVQPCHGR